jgi:hypothetical protein
MEFAPGAISAREDTTCSEEKIEGESQEKRTVGYRNFTKGRYLKQYIKKHMS